MDLLLLFILLFTCSLKSSLESKTNPKCLCLFADWKWMSLIKVFVKLEVRTTFFLDFWKKWCAICKYFAYVIPSFISIKINKRSPNWERPPIQLVLLHNLQFTEEILWLIRYLLFKVDVYDLMHFSLTMLKLEHFLNICSIHYMYPNFKYSFATFNQLNFTFSSTFLTITIHLESLVTFQLNY